MYILGVLYKQPDEINLNKILRLLPRTQSPDRLRTYLKQLEEKGKIISFDRSNIREGQITYKITQSGKDSVNKKLSGEFKDTEELQHPGLREQAIKDLKSFWEKIKGA